MAKWVYQMTPHDEWDYDGVNEMVLVDNLQVGNQRVAKALVHMDRNGFGYTLNRENGQLLVAQKFDPAVNWATHVDMETGRPQVVSQYSTRAQGEDNNTKNICPAALGTKDQQPSAWSPKANLLFVPTNHVCMDYEPFRVSYTAGQPFVGATLSMYPPQGSDNIGNFIAWNPGTGKIVWSKPERFSVWSGALATAGDVVFYGTLEGYLKAVDTKDGKELFSYRTPSGIIGNVNTFTHKGKQYVAVLSGVGGWAGIGMAAGPAGRIRRAGRGRRLQVAVRLHPARRRADRVRPAQLKRIPGPAPRGAGPPGVPHEDSARIDPGARWPSHPPRARKTKSPTRSRTARWTRPPSTATAATAIPACNATARTAPAAATRRT